MSSAAAKEYDTIFQVQRDFRTLSTLNDKSTLMDLGQGCIKYGLLDEAEAVYKRFIELFPVLPEGYYFLYQVYSIGGSGRTLQAGRARARYELLKTLKAQDESPATGSKAVASGTR